MKNRQITNSKSVQVFLAPVTLALILTFMAPACATENETSLDWFMKGYDLYHQEKFTESLDAYNKGS